MHRSFKLLAALLLVLLLQACASVQYQPLATIDRIAPQEGYRLRQAITRQQLPGNADDIFMVVMFSGGGSRAAALGYGVLDELRRQQFEWNGKTHRLFDQVDLTFGVSGGSILSAYYALHGEDMFGDFERDFLKQNLQGNIARKAFTITNWSRLTSPQFGRGDLLEEQLNLALFRHATFGDLAHRRKGPFTVIGSTDMASGTRLDFTQEAFDPLCLDLSALPLARAVAASSAVPLVFSPLTLNNNGGHCGYAVPGEMEQAVFYADPNALQTTTRRELLDNVLSYGNREKRPYIHLLDGGLVDNLGMRSLLDMTQLYSNKQLYDQFTVHNTRKIVVINVNAQNRMDTTIDRSADVPRLREVVQALINIPIDRNSQESVRQFRRMADNWRKDEERRVQLQGGEPIELYFISLTLKDLADSALREEMLNVPTSLYLPGPTVEKLKRAGADLLNQSEEFGQLRKALGLRRDER